MSILFGLLLARRFYCRTALSLSPGRTGGLLPRINAPNRKSTCKCKCFFLVGEGGFEPPKSLTTDLQSVPFGHSGTLPY